MRGQGGGGAEGGAGAVSENESTPLPTSTARARAPKEPSQRSATHSLHASTVVALRFNVSKCDSRSASSFVSFASAALLIAVCRVTPSYVGRAVLRRYSDVHAGAPKGSCN